MKHRFGVLDVFRGLFAFIVVLYHLKKFSGSFMVQNEFTYNGYLFVDFFFVLSGFVIAYNYESKITDLKQFKDFLVKRFFRLYPLHLAVLLVLLVYVVLRISFGFHFKQDGIGMYSAETFFTNLFLLSSIKFPNVTLASWNYPSWSISSEVISYFAFAIFALAINKLNLKPVKAIVCGGVVLLSMYWSYYLFKQPIAFTTYDNGFIRGLSGFFLGVICQFTFQKIVKQITGSYLFLFTALEIASLALIVYFLSSGNLFTKYGMIYEVVFFLSILIFAFEKGLVSDKIKKIGFLKEMGKISYSIYMIHSVVILFANILLKNISNKNNILDTVIDIGILLTIYFVSKWTYKNIESRFYNRSKKVKTPDLMRI